MGASSLLFLDSLTHLAEGDHVDGVVEVLNRLQQVATLHQFGTCHEEGLASLCAGASAGTCPPVPGACADLAGELVTHQLPRSTRGWR
jgi:hypothetical protein